MKAIVKTTAAPGADLLDISEPGAPGPDQVRVRVRATSICGTDYHIYRWDAWSAGRVKPPRIMGHEFAGEVLEVGAGVTHLKPGDYISGESHWTCGHCYQCRNNQRHVCANTRILGVDVDGCFAEQICIPADNAWKNDPGLPLEIACVQDPLGNAVHATLAGEIVGRTVAVLGCGPIGIFAVAVARASGAEAIYATDISPYRLELARKLGADEAIDVRQTDAEIFLAERTHGIGVDVVLEMSGAVNAIQQAMRVVRPGGRVSLMGIPTHPVALDVTAMIFKGLEVQCVVGRRLFQTWDTMKALLDSGKLDVSAAITHCLALADYDYGMQLMRDGLCGKVVFRL